MKSFILLIVGTILLFSSCHNPEIATGVPSCIYQDINQSNKDPNWMVGSVKEYQFQGRMVYAYEPDTKRIADGTTMIKDGDCRQICNIGGFAGQANNQCLGGNFFKEAVYKRTIWERK